MGIHHATKINSDSIVMYLDLSNSKCWKGKPTENLLENPLMIGGTSWNTWSGRGVDSWTFDYIDGNEVIAVTNLSVSTNESHQLYQDVMISDSNIDTYTFSIDVLVSNDADITSSVLVNTEYPFGTTFDVSYYDFSKKGQWQRLHSTRNSAYGGNVNNPANRIRVYFGTNSSNVATTGNIYFKNPQLEVGTFKTPFVEGSRSNSEAIIDLVGKTKITANSLTYTSEGGFYFNGTSDYMRFPISHDYRKSSCLEIVFNCTNLVSKRYIFGYAHNENYSYPTIGSIYYEDSLRGSLITAAEVYRTVSSTSLSENVTYHVCLNKNTETGDLDLYLNGDLAGVRTFDTATYAQWSQAGSWIGSNVIEIGKSTNSNEGQGWGNDYFRGNVYLARVHTRALSAAEIKQNFNAIRRRFNI